MGSHSTHTVLLCSPAHPNMPNLTKLLLATPDDEFLIEGEQQQRPREEGRLESWVKRHYTEHRGIFISVAVIILLWCSILVCCAIAAGIYYNSSYYICSQEVSCQEGWHSFRGSCYKFFNEYHNISVCRNDCKKEGGDLASIHSMEENDFLEGFIKLRPKTSNSVWRDTWIAGRISEVNGQFSWGDGTPWDFSNWDVGEPDRKSEGREHHECVFMGKNIADPGKWWDGVCYWELWTFDCVCKHSLVNCP